MQRILLLSLATSLLLACGGQVANVPRLTELNAAIDSPVSSRERAVEYSQLVEEVAGALDGMSRNEVATRIGRGEQCSTHQRCYELGFDDDDWFYAVGQMGEGYGGPVPILIVGFDREGKASRIWNLRIDE